MKRDRRILLVTSRGTWGNPAFVTDPNSRHHKTSTTKTLCHQHYAATASRQYYRLFRCEVWKMRDGLSCLRAISWRPKLAWIGYVMRCELILKNGTSTSPNRKETEKDSWCPWKGLCFSTDPGAPGFPMPMLCNAFQMFIQESASAHRLL